MSIVGMLVLKNNEPDTKNRNYSLERIIEQISDDYYLVEKLFDANITHFKNFSDNHLPSKSKYLRKMDYFSEPHTALYRFDNAYSEETFVSTVSLLLINRDPESIKLDDILDI